ncbi:MAG: AraC family transcriptional regulator [Methylobacterium sp.]|uniref:helix-turn-helix domain-containing protein n=1 Tax=Methylobacterium sp. TaxID=409 RepID=UPI00271E7366|nr:AraC family transcriptional regulator [Methylobacterium sp.]MDO9427101.1 AraC family transcriptional regulator [Methylobacterium sp.]
MTKRHQALKYTNIKVVASSMTFQDHRQRYELGTLDIEECVLCYAEPEATPPPVDEEVSGRGPDSHGFHGRYSRVGIRDGFSVSIGDLTAPSAFRGRGSAGPGLSLTIMIEGAGQGWLTGQNHETLSEPVGYGPGLVFINFARIATCGSYDVPAGSRFRTVELRLDLPFLERSGLLVLFEQASPAHVRCQICSDLIWIGRAMAPRGMRHAAQALLDAATTPYDDGKLEALALAILSEVRPLMIDRRRARPRARPRESMPRERELAALHIARDLMLNNLERTWSLDDLSGRVGLSPTKLKVEFRKCFGVPVYEFLQRSRLEKAMALIEDQPKLSITSISLAVGYANPSHFARLFQREFGTRPSALRKSMS